MSDVPDTVSPKIAAMTIAWEMVKLAHTRSQEVSSATRLNQMKSDYLETFAAIYAKANEGEKILS